MRVVADIVINHCAARNGWCNFGTYDFGEYGKFTPDGSWICSTDEMNTDSGAGSCKGTATGAADDGYGSEANYEAGRDWDHNNAKVREMCKAFPLRLLQGLPQQSYQRLQQSRRGVLLGNGDVGRRCERIAVAPE